MAAPLIFSGDMDYLDDFTLNVLCNSEVIDVDQDALGKQGRIIRRTDDEFVLAKPMADGSVAVGLFNLSESRRDVAVTLSELGLAGSYGVHDLWRQRDIGDCNGQYMATVNRHGVCLVRLSAVKDGRAN
jgi:alpha-galactosidase